MNELFREYSDLEGEMLYQARREALRAERGALWEARQRSRFQDPCKRSYPPRSTTGWRPWILSTTQRMSNSLVRTSCEPWDPLYAPRAEAKLAAVPRNEPLPSPKQRGSELIFVSVFDPSFAGHLNDALSAAVKKEQQWLGRALVSVAQARAKEQSVEASAMVLSGPILESIEGFLCESERPDPGHRRGQDRLSAVCLSPWHGPEQRQTCRAEHECRSGRSHPGRMIRQETIALCHTLAEI